MYVLAHDGDALVAGGLLDLGEGLDHLQHGADVGGPAVLWPVHVVELGHCHCLVL